MHEVEIRDLGSVVPLVAFWTVFTSLVKAAEFGYKIRDTVITGTKNGTALSALLRRAMLFDWYLTMAGTIFASFLFAGILFWMASDISHTMNTSVAWAVAAVGTFPAIGGVLFVLCGISDLRAMKIAVQDSDHTAKGAVA